MVNPRYDATADVAEDHNFKLYRLTRAFQRGHITTGVFALSLELMGYRGQDVGVMVRAATPPSLPSAGRGRLRPAP